MTPSVSTADLPRRVGVVGPGLMGLGVAQAIAAAGLRSRAMRARRGGGARRTRAARGRPAAAGRARPPRRRRGGGDPGARSAPRPSRRRASPAAASSSRACPEDRAIKTATLAAIARAAPDAMIATNTSGLSIARLGEALPDPARFLGLHFFSPAERMPLHRGRARPANVRRRRWRPRSPSRGRSASGRSSCATGPASSRPACSPPISTRRSRWSPKASRRRPSTPPRRRTGARSGRSPCSTRRGSRSISRKRGRRGRTACAPRFCPYAGGADARTAGRSRPAWTARRRRLLRLAGRRRRARRGRVSPPPIRPPLSRRTREAIRLRLFAAEAGEALRRLEEGIVASADDADAASTLGLGYPSRRRFARGGDLWARRIRRASATASRRLTASVSRRRRGCAGSPRAARASAPIARTRAPCGLILVRHGRPNEIDSEIPGDPSLNADGWRQARAVSKLLGGRRASRASSRARCCARSRPRSRWPSAWAWPSTPSPAGPRPTAARVATVRPRRCAPRAARRGASSSRIRSAISARSRRRSAPACSPRLMRRPRDRIVRRASSCSRMACRSMSCSRTRSGSTASRAFSSATDR